MESQKTGLKYQAAAGRKYYPRAFSNLLRMGHCAPTVMQTISDVTSCEKEWLVRLSAGMPGGIGNTGHECGAVTSSLVQLGLRFGLRNEALGLPEIFDRGHALCYNFTSCHHTLDCKVIRGNDHFPRHCIPPVLRSPGMFIQAQNGGHGAPIPSEARISYARFYAHLAENKFHCAQAVFRNLGYSPEKDKEVFEAASAFLGGTLCMGHTCSAFTAGVMTIGLRVGEIEDSPLRVFRLLAIMTVDGNAFDDRLNKFNHSMNLGYKLSKQFAREFGSTQCQQITGCDFSTPAGVDQYIQNGCLDHCQEISQRVAAMVEQILAE